MKHIEAWFLPKSNRSHGSYEYAEALYSALSEDAFYITMEESVDNFESKEAMVRYMEFSMIEGEKSGELYIPEDHEYGVSVWTKPINRELEIKKHNEKEMFLLNKMGAKSLKTYNDKRAIKRITRAFTLTSKNNCCHEI